MWQLCWISSYPGVLVPREQDGEAGAGLARGRPSTPGKVGEGAAGVCGSRGLAGALVTRLPSRFSAAASLCLFLFLCLILSILVSWATSLNPLQLDLPSASNDPRWPRLDLP